jgi:hypothetical protein
MFLFKHKLNTICHFPQQIETTQCFVLCWVSSCISYYVNECESVVFGERYICYLILVLFNVLL